MGVLETLRDLGGCAGGQLIYRLADTAMEARHPRRTRRRLRPETVARLQPLFPNVNLRSVDFVTSADLSVAHLFQEEEEEAEAITFGSRMWFIHKRRHMEETDEGLALLMHELVHVDQYRMRGSMKDAFACAYGVGFLEAGGDYATNPMEKEAYDFVAGHTPLPPPPQPDPRPWRVSWGGTSRWEEINTAIERLGDLAFGDFNGDGSTDVFNAANGVWRVSWGGTSRWEEINTASEELGDLAFGDFNGDGSTDVFSIGSS